MLSIDSLIGFKSEKTVTLKCRNNSKEYLYQCSNKLIDGIKAFYGFFVDIGEDCVIEILEDEKIIYTETIELKALTEGQLYIETTERDGYKFHYTVQVISTVAYETLLTKTILDFLCVDKMNVLQMYLFMNMGLSFTKLPRDTTIDSIKSTFNKAEALFNKILDFLKLDNEISRDDFNDVFCIPLFTLSPEVLPIFANANFHPYSMGSMIQTQISADEICKDIVPVNSILVYDTHLKQYIQSVYTYGNYWVMLSHFLSISLKLVSDEMLHETLKCIHVKVAL